MMSAVQGVVLAVSGSPAASILIKVTVTAALALAGTWLARRSRAALRHALLGAAFGVMLVLPAASLLAPPVRIAVPVVPREPASLPPLADIASAMPRPTPAAPAVHAAPAIPRSSRLSPAALWIAAWVAGAAFSLLPMFTGLRQVRSLRRSGLPWLHGQSVVDRLALDAGIHRRVQVLLHEASPGPMTCGVLDPAIVLSPDAHAWDGDDLTRALVHELEHVRRGDWASQCLARTVCAVYWFHPLVWIAYRKLVLEAERSCDDAVLGRSEATAYAYQLVALARQLVLSAKMPDEKSPLLAMANRADLSARVGAVLDSRQPRGRAGAFLVALACSAAAVLVIAMSPLRMVAAPQSAPAQTIAAAPAFDAASVKLISPTEGSRHSHEDSDPKRIVMSGSMHRFIIRAYGITDGQLGGEPDWFQNHYYSIEAVTSTPTEQDRKMLMLRSLLADRFQLKLRQEQRDLPVYALEVAAGGAKFKGLKPGEVPPPRDKEPPDMFARTFTSIDDVLRILNNVYGGRLSLDRPVVDRTHLTGSYDMEFHTDIVSQTDDLGRRTTQFPNLFHDMQSELGLKLVPTRVGMPYFVVEHAAAPTPN